MGWPSGHHGSPWPCLCQEVLGTEDPASVLLSFGCSSVPLCVLSRPFRGGTDGRWRLTGLPSRGLGGRTALGTRAKPPSVRPCFTGPPGAVWLPSLFSKYIFSCCTHDVALAKKKIIQSYIGIPAETEVAGTVWFVGFLFALLPASEICGFLGGQEWLVLFGGLPSWFVFVSSALFLHCSLSSQEFVFSLFSYSLPLSARPQGR